MAISFLVGRAGSGKTFKIIDEVTQTIINAKDDLSEPPIIVLVPDQATLNTDVMIMQTLVQKGRNATSRLIVCGFNRLINLILEDSEIVKRPKLSEFGYLLFCQQAMRDVHDKLEFFKTVSPNLASELVKSITELSQYRVLPDNLRLAADSFHSRELSDLAVIYKRFQERLSNKYRDLLTDTDVVLELLRNSTRFKNCLIWVDGFASLNQLQEDLLIGFCSIASQTKIAILLDPNEIPTVNKPEEIDPTRLFATTEKMFLKLQNRLPNSQIEALCSTKRFLSPTLEELERQAMLYEGQIDVGSDLEYWMCSNQREEIRAVIRDIINSHINNKIPFNKMAIAVSNIEAYQNQLTFELQRYKIPYVVDFPTKLGHHPYCRMVSIILKLCCSDFQWFDVLDLIRTELIDLPREKRWILENFISDHHISGAQIWLSEKPWLFGLEDSIDNDEYFVTRQRDRLHQVDEIRKDLTSFLSKVHQLTSKPVLNAQEVSSEILKIIESPLVLKIIENWSSDPQVAIVHKTAVDQVQLLFTEIASIIDPQDYRPITDWQLQIEQALRLIQQRVPPMRTNSLIVGTIEQSRMPELHTLYLMGMDNSGFPRTHIDSPIINSVLRERLRESGVQVGPTITERQYHENYLSYVAITRASNRLILSMSTQNKKGEEQQQSALVRYLKQITGGKLKTRTFPDSSEKVAPTHIIDLTETIIEALKSNQVANYSSYLSIREQYDYVFNTINQTLDPEVGGKVIVDDLHSLILNRKQQSTLETSITALENYASCPYRYYLGNVIRLSTKIEDPYGSMQLGDLLHRAIARMSVKLFKSEKLWTEADLSEELISAYSTELEMYSLLLTGNDEFNWQLELMYRTGKILLHRFGEYLQKWALKVQFKPILFEWSFSNAKPIELDNGFKIVLRGKIDRIDQFLNTNNFVIIDYKLRAKKIDYTQLYYGYSLQLPAYVLAFSSAKDNQSKQIIGCLFQNITPLNLHKPIETEEESLRRWQQRGVLNYQYWQDIYTEELSPFYNIKLKKDGSIYSNADAVYPNDFVAFQNWAQEKIVEHTSNILNAHFYPDPKLNGKALICEYCSQSQACRFDRFQAHPKKHPAVNKSTFFDQVSRHKS